MPGLMVRDALLSAPFATASLRSACSGRAMREEISDPASRSVREEIEETGLRPRALADFIGQRELKEHLSIVLEAARRRNANKRGAGQALAVTFDEPLAEAAVSGGDVLSLDVALDELARIHPRQATMVEARFFGGLDLEETAALLEVSEATILRDGRAARAWLAHELRQSSTP